MRFLSACWTTTQCSADIPATFVQTVRNVEPRNVLSLHASPDPSLHVRPPSQSSHRWGVRKIRKYWLKQNISLCNDWKSNSLIIFTPKYLFSSHWGCQRPVVNSEIIQQNLFIYRSEWSLKWKEDYFEMCVLINYWPTQVVSTQKYSGGKNP